LPSGTGFGKEDEEFTTDSLGNVYKTMPDGTSVLYRAAEVPDEFMTDSLGNVYKTMPDGSYELYKAAETTTAPLEGDQVAAVTPEAPFEPEYFQDSLGNIYISTADGGYDLYRAAEVAEDVTEDVTEDVAPETWTDPDTGALWTQSADGSWNTDYVEPYAPVVTDEEEVPVATDEEDLVVTDEEPLPEERAGGLITMMKNGGGMHMATGGSLPEGAVDNGDETYTIGNFTYDMNTDNYLYSTDPDTGEISYVNEDAVSSPTPKDDYYSTDSLGNIFKNGSLYESAPITNVGSGAKSYNQGNLLTKGIDTVSNLGSGALTGIKSALGTTAGAAGAGALLATLLGQDFSGSGDQNQGLDMSKVGVINPRTTDFGVGPTNFVGYDQYGTDGGGYTPNAELLKNLNAPGYNPVNEGDYGYEDAPVQKKASGGLSAMASPVASYYTFGQPADIMANLGMRPQPPMNPPDMMTQVGQQQPAQQAQQQGLPQQAPPMAQQQMSPTMPQQGIPQNGMMPQQQGMPPPMRSGGLPHVSNVPLVEGRMDFRNGSAVHGEGDGQSDDIPAMLADGEYVIDAETVAQIGNGSTKAGAQALDRFREGIRAHKRSAPLNKIPPKTKALTSYLKGAK